MISFPIHTEDPGWQIHAPDRLRGRRLQKAFIGAFNRVPVDDLDKIQAHMHGPEDAWQGGTGSLDLYLHDERSWKQQCGKYNANPNSWAHCERPGRALHFRASVFLAFPDALQQDSILHELSHCYQMAIGLPFDSSREEEADANDRMARWGASPSSRLDWLKANSPAVETPAIVRCAVPAPTPTREHAPMIYGISLASGIVLESRDAELGQRFVVVFRYVWGKIGGDDAYRIMKHWNAVSDNNPVVELTDTAVPSKSLAKAIAWVTSVNCRMYVREWLARIVPAEQMANTVAHELGHTFAFSQGLTERTTSQCEMDADRKMKLWGFDPEVWRQWAGQHTFDHENQTLTKRQPTATKLSPQEELRHAAAQEMFYAGV